MTKVGQDSLFDLPRQRRRGNLACFKYYISALDIGRNLIEAERFKRFSKLLHLDPPVSSDVDSAKQCNVDRHVSYEFLQVSYVFKFVYEF